MRTPTMQRFDRSHAVIAGLAGASLIAFWAATASAQNDELYVGTTATPKIERTLAQSASHGDETRARVRLEKLPALIPYR